MVEATVSSLIQDSRLSLAVRNVLSAMLGEFEVLRDTCERQATKLSALDDELADARAVQRDLLPTAFPMLAGAEMSVHFSPASAVSGDLYDAFRIDDRHVAFWVADATGHGVSAGLIAMLIRAAMRRLTADEGCRLDPSAVLAAVNGELLETPLSDCQFATAVYAIYDEESRIVRWARAGAPYPVVFARDEGRMVESSGSMLGVGDAGPGDFEIAERQLQPGMSFVVHTDGLEVVGRATIPAHFANDHFGRLASLLHPHAAISTEDQQDDLTILTLQVH